MKIKQITLKTKKVSELAHFYAQVLGFEALKTDAAHSFACKVGSSILCFEPSLLVEANYHFAFNIAENQIEAAQQWLISKNIELCTFEDKTIIDFPNWNAHALYFLDPAQNIVELIARHDLKSTATSSTFSTENILSISEIGFPVPNVKDFYTGLASHFELPVYSHISNMKSFCAAGDAEGLLIVVPLERDWFPTRLKNGIYPITAYLEGKSEKNFQYQDLPYYFKINPR